MTHSGWMTSLMQSVCDAALHWCENNVANSAVHSPLVRVHSDYWLPRLNPPRGTSTKPHRVFLVAWVHLTWTPWCCVLYQSKNSWGKYHHLKWCVECPHQVLCHRCQCYLLQHSDLQKSIHILLYCIFYVYATSWFLCHSWTHKLKERHDCILLLSLFTTSFSFVVPTLIQTPICFQKANSTLCGS